MFPDGNYGSTYGLYNDIMYTGEDKTLWRRTVGIFDVSSLSGATINSAKLVRTIGNVSSGGYAAILSRCTRPADVVEHQVTWNNYNTGNSWTSSGGDFDDTGGGGAPAKIDYTEASSTGTHEITGLVTFVTDALASRSGKMAIIIRMVDEDPGITRQVSWYSKEYGTEADRWYLEVDYDWPAGEVTRRRASAQMF